MIHDITALTQVSDLWNHVIRIGTAFLLAQNNQSRTCIPSQEAIDKTISQVMMTVQL
jgi:hypothetical protein